jgi:8-amino-7-oxononanoate synthase
MFPAETFLNQALDKRKSEGSLRELGVFEHLTDFCSNDYLGFARSEELKKNISEFKTNHTHLYGATGSRLLNGNTEFVESLEAEIAKFHFAEAGLIFNSGYDANLGLFSSLLQSGNVVLYDELVHASIHDGMRLGKSDRFPFKHNDLQHLEQRLKAISSKGQVFVAVESVYSMDGDMAPLTEISALCDFYQANLIVDEAHATGIFGSLGRGRVMELGLENKTFARVHTFGKALGCHGAIVLGQVSLISFLINFSRSFIYTTALPLHSLIVVKNSYDMLSCSSDKILKTSILISLYKALISDLTAGTSIESTSPIQCLILPGNRYVKSVCKAIQNAGFDVRPILSPTVKKGSERIRICIHAFNTEDEIKNLVKVIKENIKKVDPF